MTMVVCWLLFPLLMLALCLGCGLLVERAAGRALPGALVPSVGLAVVIVTAELLADRRSTAGLATAGVIVVALAGYAVGWRRLIRLRPDPWALGVGVAVFVSCAAPVVLSGHATFLGYFFLNDTAWHLALVDQLLERGRDVAGLPPGSFSGIVRPYLLNQYPVGTQLAAGAVRPLVGQDLAWVLQPQAAVLIALVGVALHSMLARVTATPALRALIAVAAAQPALVYAYYGQSSIKELGTLWMLVVLSALTVALLARPWGLRRVVPVAVVGAAGLDVLNLAIVPWIGVPLAAFAVAFLWQERPGRRPWAGIAATVAALVGGLLVASPALRNSGRFAEVAQQVLQTKGDLGNLVAPLQGWQVFGIWPSGDFRFPPFSHQPVAFVLIGISIGGALLGALWLLRRRPPAVVLLVASSLIAYVYLVRNGSPYANAKTMMIVSPAVLLLVLLGTVALREAGRRVESWALAAVVVFGVGWSNALIYHDANLAPRPRLEELRTISHAYAGHGPAWLNEWDELAAHFLREVNVSNMPLIVPQPRAGLPPRDYRLAKYPFDVDEVRVAWLRQFPLLVLRRSPLASRPPADYRLVRAGRYYDVYRRGGAPASTVLAHLPLGHGGQPNGTQVAAVPRCAAVRALGRRATLARARLAYVERPNPPLLLPSRTAQRPRTWFPTFGDVTAVDLKGPGTLRGDIRVPRAGRWQVWLEGVFDRKVRVRVDGRYAGSVEHELGAEGDSTLAGSIVLPRGRAALELSRSGDDLSPGDGGTNRQLGPIVLAPEGPPPPVSYVAPADAGRLCGRSLDWIEIVH